MIFLVEQISTLCKKTGEVILDFYESPSRWKVQTKPDASPVTQADLKAHECIIKTLSILTPSIPILSEEAAVIPYAARQHWRQYWLIDPLDGTKEFIEQTDEFTINIALIENQKPILGFIYAPAKDLLYCGGTDVTPFKEHQNLRESIRVSKVGENQLIIVTSRRHGVDKLATFVEKLQHHFGEIIQKPVGSSLKMCQIAEGLADFYPRLGPTSEWDTAAGEAILTAAGGKMVDTEFNSLLYNKPSLLNPSFLAMGDRDFDWSLLLKDII